MAWVKEGRVVVPLPSFYPFTVPLSFSKVASEELSRRPKIQQNAFHPHHEVEEPEIQFE